MTERKPAGQSFSSWIDQQIAEAQERGAFDDLPSAGKPLPRRSAADDGQAWLRDKLQREGVSTEELLPVPLKLRKQAERLAENVRELPTEQDVRHAVAELNHRIAQWRRIPVGPDIFVPLVSADQMVSRWREHHPGPGRPTASVPAQAGDDAAGARRAGRAARDSWWRRLVRPVRRS